MNHHMWMRRLRALSIPLIAVAILPAAQPSEAVAEASAADPIRIGLDADLTVLQAGGAIVPMAVP